MDYQIDAQAIILIDETQKENGENSEQSEREQQSGNNSTTSTDTANASDMLDNAQGRNNIVASLRNLLSDDSANLPSALGEAVSHLIEQIGRKSNLEKVRVAQVGTKQMQDLNDGEVHSALALSTALKARLQGLLQAQNLVRRLPSSYGKINKNKLHGLAVNESKVFLRQQKSTMVNTAVHILLDTSGSMRGKIGVANQACYALAKALENTKHISLGVTAFPALTGPRAQGYKYVYVAPIVKHGERVSRKFNLTFEGGTPLTESLWWLLPIMLAQKEERKIILIITDGEPDNRETALHVIEYARKVGVEVYGIGIPPCVIGNILPSNSVTLEDINQLPQAMFGLLQTALVGSGR